jgi:hypothetical protein
MTKIRIFVSDQVDRVYPQGKRPRKEQHARPFEISFASDDVGKCIGQIQKLDIHHFEVVS